MKKLKLVFLSLLVLSTAAFSAPVYADTSAQDAACTGIGLTSPGEDCEGGTGPTVPGVVRSVISMLSYIVGIAAIVAVIISAFKYITAGGDTNRISSAKSTLIYALIGVAIAALAQVLVIFVFKQVSSPSTTKAADDYQCERGRSC